MRFTVWLALSHGGPDRGFPVTTDRQTQAQNKGTKFCFDLQINLTQPQSRGQHGDRRGCVIIMRSMTYWHAGGGPGGLLGTFPQFLGRHIVAKGTRNALVHGHIIFLNTTPDDHQGAAWSE